MTFLALAYAAGLFTMASPCIFPILPFVLARADQPPRLGSLSLLLGLALTFATVATIASVAREWALNINRHESPLRLLVVATPGGIEEILPIIAKGGDIDLPALAAKYQVQVVGPGLLQT
jgi:hypothetical protein